MRTLENRQGDATFGSFVMHERLGIGGMASVHRATEQRDGEERVVALKRILPHLAEDERFVESFRREARIAMMLDHPNFVRVHEHGRVGHECFIAMEYIDGHSLEEILARASELQLRPSSEVVISLILVLCRALQYAHSKANAEGQSLGFLHRDISPENIIISRSGELKIIDFGIAHSAEDPETSTQGFKGKLSYMSPEAIRGHQIDARADLWSVGVVAHELTTTQHLFRGSNDFETIQRVRTLEPSNPSTENSSCPQRLGELILRALKRAPEERWLSAKEMADALKDLAAELGLVPSAHSIAAWSDLLFDSETPSVEEETAVAAERGNLMDADEEPTCLRERPANNWAAMGHELPLAVVDREQGIATYCPLGAAETEAREAPRHWPSGTVCPPLRAPLLPLPMPEAMRVDLVSPERISSPVASRYRGLIVALGVVVVIGTLAILSESEPTDSQAAPATPDIATDSAPLTHASVAFKVAPMSATVEIDGRTIEDPLELEAGKYQVLIKHADHNSWSEQIEVEGGRDMLVRVALARKVQTGPPHRTAQERVEGAPPSALAVSPGDLSRREGKPLRLASRLDRKRDRVRSLICIAPSGQVNSVNILSRLPRGTASELEAQLMTWRYQPLVREGHAVAACFADSVRVR